MLHVIEMNDVFVAVLHGGWIYFVFFCHISLNYQLSTINFSQLSTLNFQLSTFNSQLSSPSYLAAKSALLARY